MLKLGARFCLPTSRSILRILVVGTVILGAVLSLTSSAHAAPRFQVNNGDLSASAGVTDEPLVGGDMTFSFDVTNTGTIYDDDRLFNLSLVVTLPAGVIFAPPTYGSSSIAPTLIEVQPDGTTRVEFINIKNLEAQESYGITINVDIDPVVPINTLLEATGEWTANTLPDNSGDDRTDDATAGADTQAIDIEKSINDAGYVEQPNGAGEYDGTGTVNNNGIPDWAYSYTLSVENNTVNPTDDIIVTDIIAPGIAYLGGDVITCTNSVGTVVVGPNAVIDPSFITVTKIVSPFAGDAAPNDGALDLHYDLGGILNDLRGASELNLGETCFITYGTAIPYSYRSFAGDDGAAPTAANRFDGDPIPADASHENTFNACGTYLSVPNECDGTIDTPDDDSIVIEPSSYITIRKGAVPGTVLQDTVVTFTIDYAVSEYYDFTNVVLSDVLPDGMVLCIPNDISPDPPNSPDIAVDVRCMVPTLNAASVDVHDASFSLTPDTDRSGPAQGYTYMTWDIAASDTQQSDTGSLVYTGLVVTNYQGGGQPPIVGGDSMVNDSAIGGDWASLVGDSRTGSDSSEQPATINTVLPELQKYRWDPTTSDFVDTPVNVPIGDTVRYMLVFDVPESLDMRNIVIDDFLPRGQRLVPGTIEYVDPGADGVSGTIDDDVSTDYYYRGSLIPPCDPWDGGFYDPNGIPGDGDELHEYDLDCNPTTTGDPYGTRRYLDAPALASGGFFASACGADPFILADDPPVLLGGLQDLEWSLCAVNGTQGAVRWIVNFEAVQVHVPDIVEGQLWSNFGNASGFSNRGNSYSLRDDIIVNIIEPDLVLRKSNNAPDPLMTGTDFLYRIEITNDGLGDAYDWTIHDFVPAGIEIIDDDTNTICDTLNTSAPGSFECTLTAIPGEGTMIEIRPVTAPGVHDFNRAFPAAATYTFEFGARLERGATAQETIVNTASVEYSTQPEYQDADGDGLDDRRSRPFLHEVGDNTDGGNFSDNTATPPGYEQFRSYTDGDDPASSGNEVNNTDNSEVNIVALGLSKNLTPPPHVDPQRLNSDGPTYATINEIYIAELQVSVPGRVHLFEDSNGRVVVRDHINANGVVFCDPAGDIECWNALDVRMTALGETLPAYPTSPAIVSDPAVTPTLPAQYVGSAPLYSFDPAGDGDPVAAGVQSGSTMEFYLQEIDNSNNDDPYIFTIYFPMRVTGLDDDGTTGLFLPPEDVFPVDDRFVLGYRNDNTTPDNITTDPSNQEEILVRQPDIVLEKTISRFDADGTVNGVNLVAYSGESVQGEAIVEYTIRIYNQGTSTAFETTFEDDIPELQTYNYDDGVPGVNDVDPNCTTTGFADPGFTVSPTVSTDGPATLTFTGDTDGWDIPYDPAAPSIYVDCTYTVTIDPLALTGSDQENIADADWTGLDGTVTDERVYDDSDIDGDGTDNDDGTEDEDNAILPIIEPTIGKVHVVPLGGDEVRIGDIIMYTITLDLPIGETRELRFVDTLPEGLIYEDDVTIEGVPYNTSIVSDITGALLYVEDYDSSPTGNDGIGTLDITWYINTDGLNHDGQLPLPPTWSIINPDDATTVTVTFYALVTDGALLNQHGDTRQNQVTAEHVIDSGGTISTDADDDAVSVIEPRLALTKQVSPDPVDAGDTVLYQVQIENISSTTAYDVFWNDIPSPFVELGTPAMAFDSTFRCEIGSSDPAWWATADITTPATLPANGIFAEQVAASPDEFRISHNVGGTGVFDEDQNDWDLAAGESLYCVYLGRVRDTVPPGAVITNTADADWSSLDGERVNERKYQDQDRDLTVNSDGVGGTDDDDDDAPYGPPGNFDPTVDTNTATTHTPYPDMLKQQDSTDGNYYNASPNTYQTGELVPFEVTLLLPEGTIDQLVFTDSYNQTELAYVPGSEQIEINGVPVAVGTWLTGGQPDYTTPGTVVWSFSQAVPALPSTGSTIIPDAGTPTGVPVVLRYRMRVLATSALTTSNTVVARWDRDGDGSVDLVDDLPDYPLSATETTDIVVPVLEITKQVSPLTADAGDTLTYEVSIGNSEPDSVAYDVFWVDTPDVQVTVNTGSFTCELRPLAGGPIPTPDVVVEADTPAAGQIRISHNNTGAGTYNEGANDWDLGTGDYLYCSYTATVNSTVPPGYTIANVANATGSTINDGLNPGDPGYEDPANELEVVSPDDDAEVNVPDPVLDKQHDTSNPYYQAGQEVAYTVTFLVPQSQLVNLRFVDDYNETYFVYVSGSTEIDVEGTTYTATGPNDLETLVVSGDDPADSGSALTWQFINPVTTSSDGTTVTPALPSTGIEIQVRYSMRVLTTATGASTDPILNIDNTVDVLWDADGNPGTPGDSTLQAQDQTPLAWPSIVVAKSVTPNTVTDAGETLTYAVTITNDGPGTAYDVRFTDTLPGHVSYVGPVGCQLNGVGPILTPAVNAVGQTITVADDLDENNNDWQLVPNDYYVCRYAVMVQETAIAGETLENDVTGTLDSADGDLGSDENDYTDDALSQVSVQVPDQVTKTLLTPATYFAPGQTVQFSIAVRVPEGTIQDLHVSDTLPAGFELDQFNPATDVAYSWTGTAPTLDAYPANGDTGVIVWDFADMVVSTAPANSAPIPPGETITITFTALIQSDAAAGTRQNVAEATFDPPGDNDQFIDDDQVSLLVARPIPETVKDAIHIEDDTGAVVCDSVVACDDASVFVQAGYVVTYGVTVENRDQNAIAFDTTLDDDLNDKTTFNGTIACYTDNDQNNTDDYTSITIGAVPIGADPIHVDTSPAGGIDLLPDPDGVGLTNHGGKLYCEYEVSIDTTVVLGEILTNTVTATTTTIDGPVPGEGTETRTDDESIRVELTSVLDKLLVAPLPPASITLETEVTFEVQITLPQGTTTGLVITDTFEGEPAPDAAQWAYVDTDTVTLDGVDISALVSLPPTVVVVNNEDVVTWTFGDIVVNPGANGVLSLVYRARVTGDPETQDEDLLRNFVTASYPGLPTPYEDQIDVPVDVPALDISKAHNDDNGVVDPGQVVRYTVTVDRLGGNLAQNLVIADTLPDGFTYVGNATLDPDGAGAAAAYAITDGISTAGDPVVVTFDLDTAAAGAAQPVPVLDDTVPSLTISYDVRVPDPFTTSPFVNTAVVTGNDSENNPIPADNTDHVPGDPFTNPDGIPGNGDEVDQAQTSLGAAAGLSGHVWEDANADGVIDATETYLDGVLIELYQDDGDGILLPSELVGTAITSTHPTYGPGYYEFTNLPPGGDYVLVETDPTDYESTYDIEDDPLDNLITVGTLTAGQFVPNNDFGDRRAGQITGTVYQDPNALGSNALSAGSVPGSIPIDTDGSPIGEVCLINLDTGDTTCIQTDATGFFGFYNLPSGNYRVVVDPADTDISGIDPYIDFTPGAGASVDITLDITTQDDREAHFPFHIPVPLNIQKTAFSPDGTTPGSVLHWFVCVTNVDTINATDVTITDTVQQPDRVSYVPASTRSGSFTGGVICPTTYADVQTLISGLTPYDTSATWPTIGAGGTGMTLAPNDILVLYFQTQINDPATYNVLVPPVIRPEGSGQADRETPGGSSQGPGWPLDTTWAIMIAGLALLAAGWLAFARNIRLLAGRRLPVMLRAALVVLILVAQMAALMPLVSTHAQDGGDPPTETESPPDAAEGEAPPAADPTDEAVVDPTEEPTVEATEEPTPELTDEPTEAPTDEPTEEPTVEPTGESTEQPTEAVTNEPTSEPTEEPTVESTEEEPTAEVTEEPTETPTEEPTEVPTEEPAAADQPGGVVVTITGTVFNDNDANRSWDGAQESGVSGVHLTLYADNGDGLFDAGLDQVLFSVTTDETGAYTLENLPVGSYWLWLDEATLPPNYMDTISTGGHGIQNPQPFTLTEDMIAAALPVEVPEETVSTEPTAEVEDAAGPVIVTVALGGPRYAYALDTDGDSRPDAVEGAGDRDNDGVPNYLDAFDPSGTFYEAATGDPVAGVEVALVYEVSPGVFVEADTIQANPQTTGIDGGYTFDVLVTDPTGGGVPNDGTPRTFLLDVRSLPAGYSLSTLYTSSGTVDPLTLTPPGQVVPFSHPPNPTDPHTFYDGFILQWTASDGVVDVVNNHVPLDFADIVNTWPVDNDAAANRAERPDEWVQASDSVTINSSLDMVFTPNNARTLQPGQTTVYEHVLTNTGQQTDSYTVVFPAGTQGWPQTLEIYNDVDGNGVYTDGVDTIVTTMSPGTSFVTGDLPPGESYVMRHLITVPLGTASGTVDTTTITATSTTDTNLSSGVMDVTTVEAACLGGFIYNDTDQDGVYEPSADDYGLENVRLLLRSANGQVVDQTLTNAIGQYQFDNLPTEPLPTDPMDPFGSLADTNPYTVEIDESTLPDGFPVYMNPTSSSFQQTVVIGATCTPLDFGLVVVDPAITKSGTPQTAAPGDQVTFTITATNNSTIPIDNVTINDPLNAFFLFVNASDNKGFAPPQYLAATHTVRFSLGTMMPGEVVTMRVIVEVGPNAPRPTTLTNQASMNFEAPVNFDGPTSLSSEVIPVEVPPLDEEEPIIRPPDDATPTPQPTPAAVAEVTVPTPSAARIGGAGVGAPPSGYPSTLPQTGFRPRPVDHLVLGVNPVTWIAGGLAMLLALAGLTLALGGIWLALGSMGRKRLRNALSHRLVIGLVLLAGVIMFGAGVVAVSNIITTSTDDSGSQVSQPVMPTEAPTTGQAPGAESPAEITQSDAAAESAAQDAVAEEAVDLETYTAQFVLPNEPARRLIIPRLSIDTELVEAAIQGTTWEVMSYTDEVAHLDGTAYPGMPGNAVLAGHVMHGNGFGPFRDLDDMSPGDIILARGDQVDYLYVVDEVHTMVAPDAIEWTYQTNEPVITLVSCAGWDSEAWTYYARTIVRARLQNVSPVDNTVGSQG
ncbi:MAG: DUF11 domain-containing protein [Anaerolineae bacterium]|nr:DUF11 domain-containing protein [Anaerolineae bacterium]